MLAATSQSQSYSTGSRNRTIFQSFVDDFQKDPLLRIHRLGFFTRDLEEFIVELRDILIEKIAVSRIRLGFDQLTHLFKSSMRPRLQFLCVYQTDDRKHRH